MTRACFIFMATLGGALAQEPPAFKPPQPHDVRRYEAGWNKNPFTLQTLPVLAGADSFAKDLAVATYFGDKADPTIVIVNTKTHERTSLQNGRTAGNGWKLGGVSFGTARKDITVEIIRAHERALLKFDDPYVRALAASAVPAGGQANRQPGASKQLTIPLPGTKPAAQPPAGLNKTVRRVQPPTAPAPSGTASTATVLPPLSDAMASGVPRRRPLTVPLPSYNPPPGFNTNEPSS